MATLPNYKDCSHAMQAVSANRHSERIHSLLARLYNV